MHIATTTTTTKTTMRNLYLHAWNWFVWFLIYVRCFGKGRRRIDDEDDDDDDEEKCKLFVLIIICS